MIIRFAMRSLAESFMKEVVNISSHVPTLEQQRPLQAIDGKILPWEVTILKTDVTHPFAMGFMAGMNFSHSNIVCMVNA